MVSDIGVTGIFSSISTMRFDSHNDSCLFLQGTVRTRSVEDTLAFLHPVLSKIGISRVADVTGLDNVGLAVALSIRPNAKHLSVSQGKGFTQGLARASALMEAIECYHMENPLHPNLYGSYEALSVEYSVVDPSKFSSDFFYHPNIRKEPIHWVRARDLVTDKDRFVPHVLVCLDTTEIHPEAGYFAVSTNGLSAGNHFNEALCHSLYELIERDAHCRWMSNDQNVKQRTQINNNTVDCPINRLILDRLSNAGLGVTIFDITSPLSIPVFHCCITDHNQHRRLYQFSGSGAHCQKSVALSRAILEAAQARLTFITGTRDDVFPDFYNLYAQPVLKLHFDETDGKINFKDCISLDVFQSFSETAMHLINIIHSHGYEDILVIDHTRGELTIPVVQSIIPGMKFFGARVH